MNRNAIEMNESPETVTDISKKMYADDYFDIKGTEKQDSALATEEKRIMCLAEFDLVNWMSSSPLAWDQNLNENKMF